MVEFIKHSGELELYASRILESPVIAVDTETTGLEAHTDRLRLIQIACAGLPVLIIDCFSFLPDGLGLLKELMSSRAVKVFHNAKFDLKFLMRWGIFPHPIFDTMLGAMLLRSSGGPDRYSLKALCAHYMNMELDKSEQTGEWGGELSQSQLTYAAEDARVLLDLREDIVREIYRNKLTEIARIEFGCAQALSHIEYHGICIDKQKWHALTERTEREYTAALDELYKFTEPPVRQTSLWGEDRIYGANFDSNSFVIGLLKANGICVTGTSKADLYPYRDHPLVRALRAYRKASKALSTFLHPILHARDFEHGRLHPQYHQISAGSGRMSCDRPNIQQIPRDVAFRACFVAAPGNKLVIADYSQIELRVAAKIADDRRMIKAYREGRDLHLLTASLILDIPESAVTKQARQAAKAVNFGLIFGMGAHGLQQYASQNYGTDMTLEEASLFRSRFFNAYDGINRWHMELKKNPPRQGRTLAGRKFIYPENAPIPFTANTPVQGTAADIAKKALSLLVRRISLGARIVAVVHDEIIMECAASQSDSIANLLKHTMEEAGNSILETVPVVADVIVADNWAEK